MKHPPLTPRSRAGASLILALGILSLLILIVSAFTISMHTERMAARNSANKTRSRQYLDIGLAFAEDHINSLLIGKTAPGRDWLFPFAEPDAHTDSDERRRLEEVLRRSGRGGRIRSLGWNDSADELCLVGFPTDTDTEYPAFFHAAPAKATNLVPEGRARDTATNMPASWSYILSSNIWTRSDLQLAGRVAFLAVDMSGMIDANHITTNQFLAALGVTDDTDADEFFDEREKHVKYFTIPELAGNKGVGELHTSNPEVAELVEALGVYSYDPDPATIAYGSYVGDRGSVITTNKFDINSFGEADSGDHPNASAGFLGAVTNTLISLGYDDLQTKVIYWNLRNYLDQDRTPLTDTSHPWLDSYGIEAIPLVNELVVARETNSTNTYNLAAELWYPFAPEPPENTRIELYANPQIVGLDTYTNNLGNATNQVFIPPYQTSTDPVETTGAGTAEPGADTDADPETADPDILSPPKLLPFIFAPSPYLPAWSQVPESRAVEACSTNNVRADLSFPERQFHLESVSFDFPVEITRLDENGVVTTTITNLPLGIAEYVMHTREELPGEDPDFRIIHTTNRVMCVVSFYSRVLLGDTGGGATGAIVDEAPGAGFPDFQALPANGPWYTSVTNEFSASVLDPRRNGRIFYWEQHTETLGDTNANLKTFIERYKPARGSRAYASEFQGLPLIHRDGKMESLGEIGHLATAEPWQSLNLFDPAVAALLDLWTIDAPATNETRFAQGRIHALSTHPAAIRAMLAETRLGTNRLDTATAVDFKETAASDRSVMASVTNAFLQAGREFYAGPTNSLYLAAPATIEDYVTLPFAELLPRLTNVWDDADAPDPADLENLGGYATLGFDALEDLIRDLPERVSFRQNIILVFVRAQSLAPNARVTADSMCAALLVRDSYTGLLSLKYTLPIY